MYVQTDRRFGNYLLVNFVFLLYIFCLILFDFVCICIIFLFPSNSSEFVCTGTGDLINCELHIYNNTCTAQRRDKVQSLDRSIEALMHLRLRHVQTPAPPAPPAQRYRYRYR